MKHETIEEVNKQTAIATVRFITEHGYNVRYDDQEHCWRVVLEGINPKDDSYYPAKFTTIHNATYRALQLAAGEDH